MESLKEIRQQLGYADDQVGNAIKAELKQREHIRKAMDDLTAHIEAGLPDPEPEPEPEPEPPDGAVFSDDFDGEVPDATKWADMSEGTFEVATEDGELILFADGAQGDSSASVISTPGTPEGVENARVDAAIRVPPLGRFFFPISARASLSNPEDHCYVMIFRTHGELKARLQMSRGEDANTVRLSSNVLLGDLTELLVRIEAVGPRLRMAVRDAAAGPIPEGAWDRKAVQTDILGPGHVRLNNTVQAGTGARAVYCDKLVVTERPDEPPLEVVDVDVTPATLTLRPGQSAQLHAAATDSTGVQVPGVVPTWVSEAPEVATVDVDGLVTAIAEGEAQIIAAVDEIEGAATITVALPDSGGEPGGGELPPVTGEWEVVAEADFEDGSFGDFINSQPRSPDNRIVPDPTGAGRGMVFEIDYSREVAGGPPGRSVERQVRIDRSEILVGPGDHYVVEGEVNLGAFDPREFENFHNRKLIYVQDARHRGSPPLSAVTYVEGMQVTYQGGSAGIGIPVYRSGRLMRPNRWYHLKQEMILNTYGNNDGSILVYLDGELVIEGHDRNWLKDPSYEVHRTQIGDQHTSDINDVYQDIRWWDWMRISRLVVGP